jgi:hypothetical protein
MRFLLPLTLFFTLCSSLSAQDTVYARQVIKYLTSEKCFGRGYVKHGLSTAAKYITRELKTCGPKPLFGKSWYQQFSHPVNTFPAKCEVTLNGKLLSPGKDYIVDPASCGVKGTFTLTRVDSVHYMQADGKAKISVSIKNKLTFSVAKAPADYCGIEIDGTRWNEEPKQIKLAIDNQIIPDFKSRNIGCFFNGRNNDSMVVFSAHYDHLGGMGSATYFPGANDNASGVSVLLNLIRYYSRHQPHYKTVFIFFAGEEAGLVGSKFFVESQAIDLQKIKFLINLDLLGTGGDGIMVVNGAILEKQFQTLNQINADLHLVKDIKKRGKAANSDHYWFTEAGVPAFFIYTMGGIKAYHDVYDVEKTLPLTAYINVFRLITEFAGKL